MKLDQQMQRCERILSKLKETTKTTLDDKVSLDFEKIGDVTIVQNHISGLGQQLLVSAKIVADPRIMASLSDDAIAAVYGHEISHLLRKNFTRATNARLEEKLPCPAMNESQKEEVFCHVLGVRMAEMAGYNNAESEYEKSFNPKLKENPEALHTQSWSVENSHPGIKDRLGHSRQILSNLETRGAINTYLSSKS
jgi:hypothetical protein